jgi:hypothetical protein
MEIPKVLKDEIWDYCRTNNISNIDEFNIKLLKQGFTIQKYGATPSTKEKIVEVEKIIEVEKIVEKEVFISDNSEIKGCIEANLLLQSQITINSEKHYLEINKIKAELVETKKLLEEEKNKKKKDLYGE